MGCIAQKWWQFKDGNAVDHRIVAASVCISVQWTACTEYFLCDYNLYMWEEHNKLKQRHDEGPSPCLHMPALFLISRHTVTYLIKNGPSLQAIQVSFVMSPVVCVTAFKLSQPLSCFKYPTYIFQFCKRSPTLMAHSRLSRDDSSVRYHLPRVLQCNHCSGRWLVKCYACLIIRLWSAKMCVWIVWMVQINQQICKCFKSC